MQIRALVLPLVAATVFLLSLSAPPEQGGTVNAVLGDESFVTTFGRAPRADDDEVLRIRTHLAHVERFLRAADVSDLTPEVQTERSRLLDVLAAYGEFGAFPSAFPATNARRPCFIDAEGRICAVGHLIAETEGRAAAEAIAEAHRYDRIDQMPASLLDEWATRSGFSLAELAMIQPAYGDPDLQQPDGPTLSAGVETVLIASTALLTAANAALAVGERGSRWTGAAGAVLGGSVLAIALGNEANYRTESFSVGGFALGVGLLQALRPRQASGPDLAVGAIRDWVRGETAPGLQARWQF